MSRAAASPYDATVGPLRAIASVFAFCAVLPLAGCGPDSDVVRVSGAPGDPGPTDLVLRYECVPGPDGPPHERTCFGPSFSLYANGHALIRRVGNPSPGVKERESERSYGAWTEVIATNQDLAPFVDDAKVVLRGVTDGSLGAPDPADPWFDRLVARNDAGGTTIVDLDADTAPPALAEIVERLVRFDTHFESFHRTYAPERYCAWLRATALGPDMQWAWKTLTARSFAGTNILTRELTPAEVEELPIGGDVSGGSTGYRLRSPEGPTYELALRGLMPDEACAPLEASMLFFDRSGTTPPSFGATP